MIMRKEKLILCFTKMLKHWEKMYEKTVIRVKKIQGVTRRHELRVSFKVNMKTKCLDSIIVLFLI